MLGGKSSPQSSKGLGGLALYGADRTTEGCGGLGLGEVFVVAKDENCPLARRQLRQNPLQGVAQVDGK